MSRLIDPTICPDCRARLDASAVCTACGLRLQGPLAVRLWDTMNLADRLVEELRAVRVLVPAGAAPTAPHPVPAATAPTAFLPTAPPAHPGPPRPRRGLPSMSVPAILLSLGALCLLVASFVFVAVTWSVLGLTGRTLVLAGVTGLTGVIAARTSRPSLRWAAEALWVVVAGMVTLDLLGARSAGLFGLDALSGRHAVLLVGTALGLLGAAVASWTRTRPVTALVGMQVLAVVGAVTATISGAWLADDPRLGAAVAVAVLAGVALALRRLPYVAAGIGGVAAVSWLWLTVLGLVRVDEHTGWTAWWTQTRGWPLLVAAAYAGAGACVRRVPVLGRQVLAGVALTVLGVLAVSPVAHVDDDRQSLARSAVLLAFAVVVAAGHVVWSRAAGALAACLGVVLGVVALVVPWLAVGRLPYDAPAISPTPDLPGATSGWSHLVAAVVVAVTLPLLVRLLPAGLRRTPYLVAALLAAAVTASGVAAATVDLRPPLVVTAALLLVLTLATGALAWRLRRGSGELVVAVVGAVATAHLVVMALAVAGPSYALTAVVAAVLTTALAGWYADAERTGPAVAPCVLVTCATVLGGTALVAALRATGTPERWDAFALLAYAGLVALTAHLTSRRTDSRTLTELSALAVALVAAALTTTTADAALVLTLTGVVAGATAVGHRDRSHLGWLALALATVATIVRAGGTDLPHLELYAVPPALLLVAGGLWRSRTRQDTEADSLVGAGTGHGYLVLLLLVGLDRFDLTATTALTVTALAAAALHAHLERQGRGVTAAAAVALTVLSTAAATFGWCHQLAATPEVTSLALAVVAAVALLAAAPATRQPTSRPTVEAAAVLVGMGALALAPDTATTALVLVLLGTAAGLLAALRVDRDLAGWPAALLLAVGAVVQVADGVRVPEAYVVPGLALLLVMGVLRLRGGGMRSIGTLGGGLALGVVACLVVLTGVLDDPLVVAVASAVALGLVAAYLLLDRLDAPVEAPAAAVLAVLSTLAALVSWTALLDATTAQLAISLSVHAGLVLVAAGPVARRTSSRLALEASATAVALASLAAAPSGSAQPFVLTVLGSAVAVVAVTQRDRAQLGWLSTLVLGAATVLRVVDDVRAPELYTLPAALLMVGAGLWRLRTDAAVGSIAALGSGLTLALVPSLLLALDEPVSVRGALLGLGAALVLAYGVRQRLAAPLVLGAGTLALLAVRHLGPVAESAPRWISLGLLGAALLAVGMTWESRLRDLRSARTFVAALR